MDGSWRQEQMVNFAKTSNGYWAYVTVDFVKSSDTWMVGFAGATVPLEQALDLMFDEDPAMTEKTAESIEVLYKPRKSVVDIIERVEQQTQLTLSADDEPRDSSD